MSSYRLLWEVVPRSRRRPARPPGSRDGLRRPLYPFRVGTASFRVVGSSPTALALAAFLSSRGASVRLWTQDHAVRRAVRRQGGIVVDVVDDETRVVPVGLAAGGVAGEILVLVDPGDSEAALGGLRQAGAGAAPGGRPALVMVLPGAHGKDGAAPWAVVVCGAHPVRGRRRGTAAVRLERVSASVPVRVRPEEQSRRVVRRLSAYLPMLARG